jgi:hypothetical protein
MSLTDPPASPPPPPLDLSASVLAELLECTELNMDDLEDHTRALIQKARQLLSREPPP